MVYEKNYYANRLVSASKSASVIAKLITDWLEPKSVIDVGCGNGAWLKAFHELGISRIIGVDGPWAKPIALKSLKHEFQICDFESEFTLPASADLCVSLEVAEHISESMAGRFVEVLCGAAKSVLFSAAIPGQGGRNHVNEQFLSYWIAHFEKNNFYCFDIVRPIIWESPNVEWFYKQNTVLFLSRTKREELHGRLDDYATFQRQTLAHPDCLLQKAFWAEKVKNPSVRFGYQMLRMSLIRKIFGDKK